MPIGVFGWDCASGLWQDTQVGLAPGGAALSAAARNAKIAAAELARTMSPTLFGHLDR